MNLKIQQALSDMNFSSLTEIQKAAIPVILKGQDLMAQALTGCGKTAAFVIPIVERIVAKPLKKSSVLILSPTREITMQIGKTVDAIAKYSEVSCLTIYGGTNKAAQLRALKNQPDIIVATPGRLIDILVNDNISLKNINTLVIDEADRMLDKDMKANIMDILSFIPSEKQTLFFSATFPLEVSIFAKKLLKKPEFIASKQNITTPENISFENIPTTKKEKINSLLRIIKEQHNKKILIFANTIHCANFLTKLLNSNGSNAINLHSQRSQHQREEAIKSFSSSEIPTLIATDIAARGIDIPNIDLVINYDTPKSHETRTHRAGRTGRMNKKGLVINLITNP